jgi:uncharacterized protein YecE (DUF72 family)
MARAAQQQYFMALAPIYIGTSGWSYKHWRALFYPQGVKAADWLRYYAGHFCTTEINSSFYRVPSVDTVATWAATVPPHFRFCPKMSRYLTHMKKLHAPEEPLARFFTAMALLADKMGPVLLQLPPNLGFNESIAAPFFDRLAHHYPTHHFVLEARHASWLEGPALRLLKHWGIGWVIAQSGVDWPYAEVITANNIYLRFHGPAQLYASSYSDEQLQGFALKIKAWQQSGYRVWAFFNNDIHGYAPEDAARLAVFCGTGALEK